MGSIRHVPVALSFSPRHRCSEDDPIQLRAKITTLEHSMELEYAENDAIFAIMATSHPEIAAILKDKRRRRQAAAAAQVAGSSGRAMSNGKRRTWRLVQLRRHKMKDSPNFIKCFLF